MTALPAASFRDEHLRLLLDLTQIPTAAGRESRVIEWIKAWVTDRPDLRLSEDAAGNLVIEPRKRWGKASRAGTSPIYITAHLDHPAFVVERIIAPQTIELSFRGGVMDEYFKDARIVLHAREQRLGATLTGEGDGIVSSDNSRLFKTYLADVDDRENEDQFPHAPDIRIGDIATWALPPAEVDSEGLVHTPVCDDLAAAAAALCAFDTLRSLRAAGQKLEDVRLLFTRSEEIGFTGAIAASKLKTMPKDARVIALENSRSFADSPLGGGPIVRVGDRMSIFDPRLTAACAKRAEDISGHASTPTAKQKNTDVAGWKWQRKLMAGGACEATVFCTYGYQATCLCLPLGNYHNMAHLAEVQAGTYDVAKYGPPRVGREFIHKDDYFGLVDLLVAIGQNLPDADPALERIEKLFDKTKHILGSPSLASAASTKRKKSTASTARSQSRERTRATQPGAANKPKANQAARAERKSSGKPARKPAKAPR